LQPGFSHAAAAVLDGNPSGLVEHEIVVDGASPHASQRLSAQHGHPPASM
jgi:hypothetical protein